MSGLLLLVRHSLPEVRPDVPASQWRLSDVGRARCVRLADIVAPYNPKAIATSLLPRAAETGQIVSNLLGIPCETVAGLGEHDRSNVPWLKGQPFRDSVAALFAQPDRLVFGMETGEQAYRRFADAVTSVQRRRPGETIAVVSHGTVISLFVGRITDTDSFTFWERIEQPCVAVLDLEARRLVNLVNVV